MASKQRILRLSRVDENGREEENEFCLVNVTQTASHPLDLKLVATDGEDPFVTSSK
jgi:hypothetical protein